MATAVGDVPDADKLPDADKPPDPDPDTVEGHRLSGARYRLLLTCSAVAVVAAFILAIVIGAVAVPADRVLGIIAYNILSDAVTPFWSPVENQIVWQFRLPRAILATVVGAGLALVGAVMQALVRNPLADPYLLGVSSGAALGAVIVLVLGTSAVGGLSLSVAAFAGSLLALVAVYGMAQRRGQVTPSRLILAGVALAYLFQAAYSFVLQKADAPGAAQSVLFWLLGSLGGARWSNLGVPTAVVTAGLVVLLVQYRPLNALIAGEETAVALGINLARLRFGLFLLTSLLVGVMVAAVGAIAFVGLIVPHVARLIVGSDHRRMLPLAALIGATFLLLVDILARTADQPQELPLSIVTAAVGVPFFIWLLRRQDRSGRLTVT